mgnify:FL=1
MTIEHSDAYYDYKRNDPNAENPFTDSKERARAERVVAGIKKVNVDTEKYLEFVEGVTSDESLYLASLLQRVSRLEAEDDCNLPQLLTAALGLTAEAGEFTEVVKKIILQGKPYNEDNIFHMKRELGDICWYIAQACMALDTTFDEIIEMNVEKLKARYPGGEFNVRHSENRAEGDL